MDVCDRVVYLKNGEIKMDMPAEQIFKMGLCTLGMGLLNCIQTSAEKADEIELQDFSFSYDTDQILQISSLALQKGAVKACCPIDQGGFETIRSFFSSNFEGGKKI